MFSKIPYRLKKFVFWLLTPSFLLELLVAQQVFQIQHLSKFNKPSQWSTYPTVSNLHKFTELFSLNKCLFLLDNIRGVDIAINFSSPVIIREIAKYTISSIGSTTGLFVRGPRNLYQFYPQNLTASSSNPLSFPCRLSKYLEDFQYKFPQVFVICLRLNLTRFWAQTKPQNCKVHLILFPPIQFVKIDKEPASPKFAFPSLPGASLKVFVRERVTMNEEKDFIRSINLYHHFEICDLVILSLYVTRVKDNSSKLVPPGCSVKDIELLRICAERWSSSRVVSLSAFGSDLVDFRKLVDLTLPSLKSNLIWRIGHTASWNTVFGQMERILGYCAPSPVQLSLKTPVELVGHGYALTWLSIMGNYTISYSYDPVKYRYYGTSCTQGLDEWRFEFEGEWNIIPDVEFEFVPYIKTRVIFPYFPADDQSGLRFVSCGKRGLAMIPFQELVNVYDMWIWLMILLTMITLSIFMRLFSELKVSTFLGWMATLTILLEQGHNALQGKRVRWATGMFLLMGIVISNAYRNSNVYNMIAPRRHIPYQFAKELIADNFTMLTRLHSAESPYSSYRKGRLKEQLEIAGGSYYNVEVDNDKYLVGISDVTSDMMNFIVTFDEILLSLSHVTAHVREVIATTSFSMSGVLQGSHLIPNVTEKLRNFNFPHLWTYFTDEDRGEILESLVKTVRQEETEIMYNLLRGCKKVALILPQHMCYDYSRKIKQVDSHPEVFIGREVYSDVEWLFSFKKQGSVPRQIIMRIKVLYESGHWQKWSRLFSGAGKNKETDERVVAAGLDGNVVLIFYLWMCGLAGGCVYLCLEKCKLCI